MKRKNRKTDKCLNCSLPLEASYEYCPRCGQENDDRQLSFGRLIRDFLDNYFSLDSRFGRSIKPFFFQPGKLTLAFMEGKRMSYANPIRLYLVISLIHFFFFSIYMHQDGDNSSTVVTTDHTDSVKVYKDMEIFEADSLQSQLNWPMTASEWKTVYRLTKAGAPNYPVTQIEDSIHNERRSYTTRYINRQIIKLMKSDRQSITAQVIKNIPMLMFVLMPVFALLLKMFFSEKLYINHIVHALHLHSFSFLVLTIQWISFLIFPDFTASFDGLLSLLILVYIIFSFRNTYALRYMRAIVTVFAAGFLYMMVLALGLALEAFISLMTY